MLSLLAGSPGLLFAQRSREPVTLNFVNAEIEAVLKETRGRISGQEGAAAKLGVAASTLESRIRALKINKHQFRSHT